jgi:hypothetical protein
LGEGRPAAQPGGTAPASPDFGSRVQCISDRYPRRLLNRVDLCAYVGGLDWSEVARWIEGGMLPRPLFDASLLDRTARWDVTAVSRSLRRLSAVASGEGDVAVADARSAIHR